MSPARIPPRASRWLAIAGAGLFALAAAWWASVFLRVLANGYLNAREALACAASSSTICDLAMSLCGRTHPLGLAWYSPVLLWSSVTMFSAAALLIPTGSPKR